MYRGMIFLVSPGFSVHQPYSLGGSAGMGAPAFVSLLLLSFPQKLYLLKGIHRPHFYYPFLWMESCKGQGLPLLLAVNAVARPPGLCKATPKFSASLSKPVGQALFWRLLTFNFRRAAAEGLTWASVPSQIFLSLVRVRNVDTVFFVRSLVPCVWWLWPWRTREWC